MDNVLQTAKPTVLKKAIEVLRSNGVFNGEQLMQQLTKNNISFNKKEVEILLGLDEGALTDPTQNTVFLDIREIKKTM